MSGKVNYDVPKECFQMNATTEEEQSKQITYTNNFDSSNKVNEDELI